MAQVVDRRSQIKRDRRTCTLYRAGDASAIARVFTRHFLKTLHREDLIDSAELCVSEIVTNAMKHTKSTLFIMNMYPNDESPLFEVWDNYFKLPIWPPKGAIPDLESEGGRGLQLVQSLATDCGALLCRPIPNGGKFVWCRF